MAVINNLILKEKTGTSAWTDRTTINNPTAGSYSANYAFAAGIHAIKCTAADAAGNSADSSVVLFESGSTRKATIVSATDNVSPVTMSYTTPFSHTNDPTPTLNCVISAGQLSIFGETASVNVNSVKSAKLFAAWKDYVEPNVKAAINYASGNVGTHATIGGAGQVIKTITSGFSIVGNEIVFSITPDITLLGNRIYTFGVLWEDQNGVWSATDASLEFSLCIDLVAPAVTIATPQNGYIYNGTISVVTGTVSDTL